MSNPPYLSAKTKSSSFLSLVSKRATGSVLSEDKLEKRRATNRRSQQKARENKEELIRKLQEENDRLRDTIHAKAAHPPPSYTSSTSPPDLTHRQPSSSIQSPLTPQQGIGSVDLDACREGFLAVLASVCDPHLNTIHAVCQKFSQSRGQAPSGPSLNPPRPVDRPLNIWKYFSTESTSSSGHSGHSDYSNFDLFNNLNPPSAFIPSKEFAGPLTVPFLEPPHPTFDLEMDSMEIWRCVLSIVDLSRTDAEYLASKITEKVRCYGFGPVVMKADVVAISQTFPQLAVDFL